VLLVAAIYFVVLIHDGKFPNVARCYWSTTKNWVMTSQSQFLVNLDRPIWLNWLKAFLNMFRNLAAIGSRLDKNSHQLVAVSRKVI